MTGREFSSFFRNPETCSDELVAVGGDLSVERLLYAYSHGIFPWSENPIRWYCLQPRAIFDLNKLNLSRSTYRKIRGQKYKITVNQAFTEVMRGCSCRSKETSWITPGFINAYSDLHREGHAHSVEAWDENGNLAGGVYGVAIGKFFAGESMFSFLPDAGKISLYYLFEILKNENFRLFDTQQLNVVTWNLGAYEIPKSEYLRRLKDCIDPPDKLVLDKYMSFS